MNFPQTLHSTLFHFVLTGLYFSKSQVLVVFNWLAWRYTNTSHALAEQSTEVLQSKGRHQGVLSKELVE